MDINGTDTTTAAYAKSLPKVGVRDLTAGDVVNIFRANWTVAGITKEAGRYRVALVRVSDGRKDTAGATGATRFGMVARAA